MAFPTASCSRGSTSGCLASRPGMYAARPVGRGGGTGTQGLDGPASPSNGPRESGSSSQGAEGDADPPQRLAGAGMCAGSNGRGDERYPQDGRY